MRIMLTVVHGYRVSLGLAGGHFGGRENSKHEGKG